MRALEEVPFAGGPECSGTYRQVIQGVLRPHEAEKSGCKSAPHFCKRKNYKSFTLKQTGDAIGSNTVYIMRRRYRFYKFRDKEGNKFKLQMIPNEKMASIFVSKYSIEH